MINLILLGLLLLALSPPNLHAQVCANVTFISFECVQQEKAISKEKVYCKIKVTNYQAKTKTRTIRFQDFEAGIKETLSFDFSLCSDMTIELDLFIKGKPDYFTDDFVIDCSKIDNERAQEAHFKSALGAHYIFKFKIFK